MFFVSPTLYDVQMDRWATARVLDAAQGATEPCLHPLRAQSAVRRDRHHTARTWSLRSRRYLLMMHAKRTLWDERARAV